MKRLSLALALLFGVLILADSLVAAPEKPNIVLIFIDDLGWSDLGCYGDDFVETPRIDQLAAQGLRFTDYYAAGAVCSATRCSVQAGQNQVRVGITAHITGHWRPFERVITPQTAMALPLDIVTVGESMKAANYATGYIGKWHLGNSPQFQPDRQGYDFSVVINGPHLPGKYRVQGRKDIKPKPGQYRTEFEGDLALQFIRKNKDHPFFLMVSPFAVHIPLAAMSVKVEKYRKKAAKMGRNLPSPIYAAMIEHCDDLVGRIVDTIEAQGLTGKTMIVFSSDNGGLYRRYDYIPEADDNVSDLAPLKGQKGSLHEGGIRVPLIIKYPPLTTPGSITSEPAISYDFYPTFVDLAGGKLPENQTIDGLSLVPLFTHPEKQLDREALYFHYPHYHHDRPASAIRKRDWKLIEYIDGTGDIELYHLSDDIGETHNLARERPGLVADLKRNLAAWRISVNARMPLPNPSYDSERAPEWWSRRSGAPIDSKSRKRFPPTEKDL